MQRPLGCIAGHYMVYGPLTNGATSVIYEGAANVPDRHRHFQIIENFGVTVYFVALALIDTFMKWGREIPDTHDLSSLRLLGGMGESSNPDAPRWYREVVGGGRCPVVDTWWQSETGAVMIAPLPGLTAAKPGSPTTPVPGISAHIVDAEDDLVAWGNTDGSLWIGRGRRCCGEFGVMTSALSRRTGRSLADEDGTSPGSTPGMTWRTQSGSSAALTTWTTYPATNAPPRVSRAAPPTRSRFGSLLTLDDGESGVRRASAPVLSSAAAQAPSTHRALGMTARPP